MQQETVTWPQIAIILTMLGGFGGIVKWVLTAFSRRDDNIAAVAKDLADYKLVAEREFASAPDLSAAERRFADSVDGLRQDFRDMTQRLNQVLDSLLLHAPNKS